MHPIESMMTTAMEQIKQMVDVNTIVGDPVQTRQGNVILPISKVSFGFVAGGGEYKCAKQAVETPAFAGGTGAGVSVNPVAFLIVGGGQVRLLPALNNTSIDRLIEMIPQILDDIKGMLPCKKENRIPV